jgi:hypothetical protein
LLPSTFQFNQERGTVEFFHQIIIIIIIIVVVIVPNGFFLDQASRWNSGQSFDDHHASSLHACWLGSPIDDSAYRPTFSILAGCCCCMADDCRSLLPVVGDSWPTSSSSSSP